jgi:NAD(P)-dependent dehydrogenase (short-subunit alcohol dehydrogenase family)
MAEQAKPFRVMELFRLDGETAMITGAGNGLGRIAALTLAQAGAEIAVTDLDGAAAERVAGEIADSGGRAKAYTLDVADSEAIVATVDRIAGDFGRLDVLINNAGIARREATPDITLETWEHIFAVNVTAAFLCAREAGRHMLAAGRGRIVNMVSTMGMVGGALYPNLSYHASKGALVNMTRALGAEWAGQGIRVNAIAPTWTRTQITEILQSNEEVMARIAERTPMGRMAEPEEMAGAILYLSSAASSMVTGHVLAVDGGYLAV